MTKNNQNELQNFEQSQRLSSLSFLMTTLGIILIFPAAIGSWFSSVSSMAGQMSDYMQDKTSIETTLYSLLSVYLFITVIVSIYFIVVGSKFSNQSYTFTQLRGVLIRVAIFSFFWPIIGLAVLVQATTLLKTLSQISRNSEPQNSSNNPKSNGSTISTSQLQLANYNNSQFQNEPTFISKNLHNIRSYGIAIAIISTITAVLTANCIPAILVVIVLIAGPTTLSPATVLLMLLLVYIIFCFIASIILAIIGFRLDRHSKDINKLKDQCIRMCLLSIFSPIAFLVTIFVAPLIFQSWLSSYALELKLQQNHH